MSSGHQAHSSKAGSSSRQGLIDRLEYGPRHLMQVVIVALPGASPMNLFGAAEVFAKANALLSDPVYEVRIVSATTHECPTAFSTTLKIDSTIEDAAAIAEIDTLMVAGGSTTQAPSSDHEYKMLLDWVAAKCARARRYGAFCSGAMVLAEAGLLREKQVTTHWGQAAEMAARYPQAHVFPDRVFVKDGNCYTSGDGASVIDLVLALVEEDLGTDVVVEVAKQLALFLRRSGEQPQLSTTLLAQTSAVGSIHNLLIWMADHLNEDLSNAKLARRVAMSQRNFTRSFGYHVGKSPGQHVIDLRLEAAQRSLAVESLSLGDVARVCGFSSVEAFRRQFIKRFGDSPGRYRSRSRVPSTDTDMNLHSDPDRNSSSDQRPMPGD